MCIGIPMKIFEVDGTNAYCQADDKLVHVDLSLVGTQPTGTWILNFLGVAREVLTLEQADKIGKAVSALMSIHQGGEIGEAFADLEEQEPQLPPHLAQALADGKKTA